MTELPNPAALHVLAERVARQRVAEALEAAAAENMRECTLSGKDVPRIILDELLTKKFKLSYRTEFAQVVISW